MYLRPGCQQQLHVSSRHVSEHTMRAKQQDGTGVVVLVLVLDVLVLDVLDTEVVELLLDVLE